MTAIDQLRDLPQVDSLADRVEPLGLPRPIITDLARTALEMARESIRTGTPADPLRFVEDLVRWVALSRTTRVLNATGVLLHTNLGRAPLSKRALEAMTMASEGYSNLEIELAGGQRGGRGTYVTELVKSLTGGEDAFVVNNNAAAVVLALAATSAGKAVPVARGELIEIGGSYRLPEVMTASGARLVDIGTTNRTRSADYSTAAQLHDAGALLKVHTSNFRIDGFTEEATVADLAEVATTTGLPLIFDIGSGHLDQGGSWLVEGDRAWLADEPAARQAIDAGADLVTFSGDKLLGGPQAGVITGKKEIVEAVRRHPLARAMRLDAGREAALGATLESFLEGDVSDIPLWSMARIGVDVLGERVARLQGAVGGEIVEGVSLIGAGSVPGHGIPTPQLRIPGAASAHSGLLAAATPVVMRRHEGALIADLRTIAGADDQLLADVVGECL